MTLEFADPSRSSGPLARAAHRAPAEVAGVLAWAAGFSGDAVTPGRGATLDLWDALATLAARDVALARAVEPHWDATAILHQADRDAPTGSTWGVFAAEGGFDPLIATTSGDRWTLSGTKPWCSLAGVLDRALITARTADGDRRLFAIDLHHHGVTVDDAAWIARGLVEIPSAPIRLAAVPAEPVGDPGWYLTRPGFEFGAIGVAACWYGGAVRIGRAVHAAAAAKPNPFLLAHLGRIDQLLQDGRRALAEAAALVDGGTADGRILAKRVRATVAFGAEEILARAAHALGPAPFALDEAYAKRVADLGLYLRQHHAERDLESLGTAVAEGDAPW